MTLTNLVVLLRHYIELFGFRGVLLLTDRLLRRQLPSRIYCRIPTGVGKRVLEETVPLELFVPALLKSDQVSWFAKSFPTLIENKRVEAVALCAHVFDFLGTGPTGWGARIDWQQDVKSGHHWAVRFYTNYGADLTPGNGSDAKIPWELNRFHHLVTLAQAWLLTGEERFADECFAHWESWLADNPFRQGVNWSCSMEVAIRAVNWLWAAALVAKSSGWNQERRASLVRAVREHGIYIEHNLEVGVRDGQLVTANHYLANLSGLACVGFMCPQLRESKRWRDSGMRGLEREIRRQVLPDGFFFESSSSYHRLALELFLVPALLARGAGHEVSTEYWERLEKMMEVILRISAPDGCVPQIGDNDNGRFLIFSQYPNWPTHDHRYLLAVGAVLFQREDFKRAAENCREEVFWLMGSKGVDAYEALENRPLELTSEALPWAGLYIFRSKNQQDYALVRAGGPLPHAPTAHAHNDALSLELWIDGQPVLRDSGTYCYTSDLSQRDWFRSTQMHNTVIVDGQEMNRIPVEEPFRLEQDVRVRVVEWVVDRDEIRLVAEHDGYKHLPGSVLHRRTVRYFLCEQKWDVKDELIGEGDHSAELWWHFAPGLVPAIKVDPQESTIQVRTSAAELVMHVGESVLWRYRLQESAFSPGYGIKVQAQALCIYVDFQKSCWVQTTAIPVGMKASHNQNHSIEVTR